jgi:hypothetical protein
MGRLILAASIAYVDPSSSPEASGTLYVATESFTTPAADTPAHTTFLGRLSGDIRFETRVSLPFIRRPAISGLGNLRILNHDGALDGFKDYRFRDGAVVIKALTPGQQWDAGTLLATAIADRVEITGLNEMRVVLRDPTAVLEQPLQSATYESGSGAPDAVGKVKPISFGTPKSCEPQTVDAAGLVYHLHDGVLLDIDAVRDNGDSISFNMTDDGYGFELAAAPAGRLIADPVATGSGLIYAIDSAVKNDGGTLSNQNRTLTNPYELTDSPHITDLCGFGELGRSAAAGGKYYFEVYADAISGAQPGASDFPDGHWDIWFGVGASQPTNPHRPNNADEYSAQVNDKRAIAGSPDVVLSTWEDGTKIDTENDPAGITNAEGVTFGILVNFDDMEVSFRVNGTGVGSALSISANSPLDTFYPLLAVAADNQPASDNAASLYLHEEFFEESVPGGYTPWGGAGISANTSFEEFVASITARISGLTVDTTTRDEIDALGYSYSYYLKNTITAAEILTAGCRSHGGWWFVGADGSLKFGQLKEPVGSGAVTLTDVHIIDVRRIERDTAVGLSNRMGAIRNWHPISADSADAGLSESDKLTLSSDYQHEAVATSEPAEGYEHVDGGELTDTLFRTAADADTEIERIIALYTTQRSLYTIEAAFDISTYPSLEPGATIDVSLSRYDFSQGGGAGAFSSGFSEGFDIGNAGKQLLVLGVEGSFSRNRVRILAWG